MHDQQVILRDYPRTIWLFGAFLVAVGGYLYYRTPQQWFTLAVPVGIFLLILIFSSTLTVKTDGTTSTLILSTQSLVRRTKKEIPLATIAAITIEQSISNKQDGRTITYRIAIRQVDGQTIPLRSYYTGGLAGKVKQAKVLSAHLDLPFESSSSGSGIGSVSGLIQHAAEITQAAFENSPKEERIIKGVRWMVQGAAQSGTSITRLHSTEFNLPEKFLFLAQKAKGQKTQTEGMIATLSKTLFQKSISMYGFTAEDTPYIEFSEALVPLDPQVDPYFSAFTSDPDGARQLLNSKSVQHLASWAEENPLKMITIGQQANQLVVLFCPRGLYLAFFGKMDDPALDRVASLGADLIRAQQD
ncbi:MAG: hypothetical protein ABIJ39_13300 [Chloroflexota bacterium]